MITIKQKPDTRNIINLCDMESGQTGVIVQWNGSTTLPCVGDTVMLFVDDSNQKHLIILSDRENPYASSFSSSVFGFSSNKSLIELKDYELTEVS